METTPTKTQAIANLLPHITHADLASMYNSGMEVQVTVAQDNGAQIQGDYMGKDYIAYTDNVTTWKPFRIPWNAATTPEYEDKPIRFDLAIHYNGIGMTGWNWQLKRSIYVAFDFDSIIGHKTGLAQHELEEARQAAWDIPWVTVRKSTSGTGYHFYVFLAPIETLNHTEHAAIARAVLAKLSSVTGYDFRSKVDTCGGNMWIAHRKMQYNNGETEGLRLLKQGTLLTDIPINWKDHLPVVTRKSHKVKIEVEGSDAEDLDKLMNQRLYVPLDDEHLRIIKELEGTSSWWDNDHHLLVSHTWSLQQLHEKLSLRGLFRTVSTGKDQGNDWNVFCVPIRNGGWVVRRFTRNCVEDPSWFLDKTGWTTCYYNRHPDLPTVARAFGGVEREKGGFVFNEASVAIEALGLLGTHMSVPTRFLGRQTIAKDMKDGRLSIKIKHEPNDSGDGMVGWIVEGKFWVRLYNAPLKATIETEVCDNDQLVRHLVTVDGGDAGWVLKSEEQWHTEPLVHIKLALGALGYSILEGNAITGSNITKSWSLVIQPFAPEYPGNRQWNRRAPQFTFLPSEEKDKLYYPTWRMILEHCGSGLNEAVENDTWCKQNGLLYGYEYLKCWCASLFQEPLQPLPYIFFYGPQNCGKSIFHECLSMLFNPGYVRADVALTNPSGFNGELENAVLCVVEETDLKSNKIAYNRIKDWVTSVRLPIHQKMKTPTHIVNTTHWIQVANEERACPVFPGDTRIVIVPVKPLKSIIPKRQMFEQLTLEAPDFLAALLTLELPPTNDRLNLPVIMTRAKQAVEESNLTELEIFLNEHIHYVPGCMLSLSEFYERFMETLEGTQVAKWPKPRISREMPQDQYPKGRRKSDAAWCFGNMSLTKRNPVGPSLYRPLGDEFLRPRETENDYGSPDNIIVNDFSTIDDSNGI